MSGKFEENSVTRLFGVRFPIVQAGMVWCSGWKLASAVSNAGALGLIGAGSMDPDTLRLHIRKARAATQRPFGVNLPLLYSHIEDQIDILLAEKVKIVFTSAGNPHKWTPVLKENGVKVVHVVSNLKFALKAEEAGCDAVVAEGFEAGGHNGREEITTMCLVPQIRKHTHLPLIAAGGIGSGASMMAAMALGADGVQVGTRFVATNESSAHPDYKARLLRTESADTILALKSLNPVRLIKNGFFRRMEELESRGLPAEELRREMGAGNSRVGMFEGDLENGELEIGQVVGMLEHVLPAAQVVGNMVSEYQELKNSIGLSKGRF